MVVEECFKFKPRHPLDIINEELTEMQSNPSDDFKCLALTTNPYEWQFGIRGPNGTEFESGIYHGQIQFPEGYPRKLPKFKLLTENGCFEIQTDISFLLFRGESFAVPDALHRLIELLPIYPFGALGSVGYNKEERRALAKKFRAAPPKYLTAELQKLIDEIHKCMLSKAPPVPSNRGGDIRMKQNQRSATTAEMDIEKELKEMQSNPSKDFTCLALPGNVYDWQLGIRGPNGTKFEGGIYHASIQFPEEYPRKRPIFKLLTENGRFKTQTEICFPCHTSNVREALHRLIELLPTEPDGALGSVRYDREERRALAIVSREAPPRYGTAERQKLIHEIHEDLLRKAPPPLLSNRGGDIHVSSQNYLDKRERGICIISGNTINANNSNQVGIWDVLNENTTKSDDLR